jgi:hypothetical protein
MIVIFNQIFQGARDVYVKKKLQNWSLNFELSSIESHGASISIAEEKDFPLLKPEQNSAIEARKRCALKDIEKKYPLLSGEVVQADFFTFLKSPYNELPINTPVLKRVTNMAETYYLFEGLKIVDGTIEISYTTKPTYTTFEAAPIKSVTVEIAKNLAGGLVSGIGDKIGALIFDAIFPPGVPSYFDEVYREIRKIVKEEVVSNTIDIINGRINGTQQWVATVYTPRKNQDPPIPREELFDMLKHYVDLLFTEAVGILLERGYDKPGFSVFLVAAGMHLALLQEQALVDPHQNDPTKSSFAESVKLTAKRYADHIADIYPQITDDRKNAVEIQHGQHCSYIAHDVVCTDYYRFHDNLNKKNGKEWPKDKDHPGSAARNEAEKDRENYYKIILGELSQNLGDPGAIEDQWRQLVDKPIPVV